MLGNEAAAGHLPHPAGHGGLKGLGLICKVNVDVVQLEHVHAALGQARHIGRGSMAVGRLDILKAERGHLGRAVVDRQRIAALHVVALAVGVAVVERVDDERHLDLVHLDVLKAHAHHDGIFAAPTTGLDAQAAIGALKEAVARGEAAHAARDLGAEHDRAVPVVHVALLDQHVAGGRAQGARHGELAALDGDAVVAHREVAALDSHAAAALGVEAVGVRRDLGALDVEAPKAQVAREHGMDIPARGVAHGDARKGHVTALREKDQARARGDADLLGLEPPVVLIEGRLAVDHAAAVDRGAAHAHAHEGAAEHAHALALPGAERKRAGTRAAAAGLALHAAGQIGQVLAVEARLERGTLGELERDIALEKEALDAVGAGRYEHAALLRAAHDGGLDGGGVVALAVARGAELAHVEGKGLLLGDDHRGGHLGPALEAHAVDRLRLEVVDVGHDAIGLAALDVVDEELERLTRLEQAAVVELDRRRAGAFPNNG